MTAGRARRPAAWSAGAALALGSLVGCSGDRAVDRGDRPSPIASDRLADVGTFALALGVEDDDAVAELAGYDLVVVDGAVAPAVVAELQAAGSLVLGYLSVGTLEPGRPWFAEAEAGGWLLDHWDDWDEWYAAVDRGGLRALLAREGRAILDRGVDGLFLDNVDMVEAHPDQADGMERLVAALDDLAGPDRLVMSQNGDASVDRFVDHLDAWNREDVSATYDGDAERYVAVPTADAEAAAATLARLHDRGLLVTATDYTASADDPLVARAAARACRAGAVPFASDLGLDRIPAPSPCG